MHIIPISSQILGMWDGSHSMSAKTSGLTELCQVTVNFFPFKQKILKYFLTKEVNLWCCICFLAWKELQQVQRDLAEPCPSQRLWAHQSCPQCWEHSNAKINLLAVFSFQKPSGWHQRDWQALIISECKGDTCSAGAKGEFDLWVTKQVFGLELHEHKACASFLTAGINTCSTKAPLAALTMHT